MKPILPAPSSYISCMARPPSPWLCRYTHFRQVRQLLGPLTLALLAGSSVAIVSAVLIARALRPGAVIQASLAPKSNTTPIAMGIAKKIGGLHRR